MRTRPRPSLVQFIALLGGLLLCLMTSAALAQTSLVPLSSFSNTQQSTTSTTLQNTDVVITAANLASGQPYLILYAAAYGGSTTSELPQVAVTYGSTTIAIGADEGSSSGTPSWRQ